jgi:hypothetical protein
MHLLSIVSILLYHEMILRYVSGCKYMRDQIYTSEISSLFYLVFFFFFDEKQNPTRHITTVLKCGPYERIYGRICVCGGWIILRIICSVNIRFWSSMRYVRSNMRYVQSSIRSVRPSIGYILYKS